MKYTIYIDGGSKGNGSAGQEAYGSSKTFKGGIGRSRYHGYGKQRHYHFGNFTNNEAEYLVLLETLQNLIAAAETGFFDNDDIVVIKSDSQLVVEQVNNRWKVKDDGLRLLHCRVHDKLSLLSGTVIVAIEKAPRDEVFSVLGH